MNSESAISLSKTEILDKKILNFRVFRDGAGTVAHIIEMPLFEIMLVEVVVKAIIGIIATFFIF